MAQSQIEIDAFDTVQRFNHCPDRNAVYDILLDYIGHFGFDCFIYSNMPPVGFQLEPHIIMQNWPDEWYNRYISYKYYDHDPVARALESELKPHLWHDILSSASFSGLPKQIMSEAYDFGLRDGYIIPLEGDTSLTSCLSFSGPTLELPPFAKDALYMVAIYAHETIANLRSETQNPGAFKSSPLLTPREHEILSWVANGKTDEEIGIICSIAPRTATEHVKNAAVKLDAVNRTQAVAKALIDGHITI